MDAPEVVDCHALSRAYLAKAQRERVSSQNIERVFDMDADQKEKVEETVTSIVRDSLTSREIPSDEEIKRRVSVAVDALTAGFAKINEII